MSLISSRDPDKGIIEGRFISAVLQDQSANIFKDMKMRMTGRTKQVRGEDGLKKRMAAFTDPKWNKISTRSNDNTLTVNTIFAGRFADMRTMKYGGYARGNRKVPPGKRRKKNYEIYNKPIWRHKKFIVRTLSFGFTDEVKESFRQIAKDEGLIE